MKYLVGIYEGPDGRGHAETTARFEALLAEIAESGELIGGATLADSAGTRTVRVRGGVPVVADGPFGATAEQLSRYVLVDCESVERATAIAARLPGTGSGAVEVRPVMEPSGQEM